MSIHSNSENYLRTRSISIKDYILLLRTNWKKFIIISLVFTLGIIAYAFIAEDIYKSTVTLKILRDNKNVLGTVDQRESVDLNDRFISNEISVIKSYDAREQYASVLIDSFNNSRNNQYFEVILTDEGKLKSKKEIIGTLKEVLLVEQVKGLDIVEISALSSSPYEAALIANCSAEQYKELNLDNNRNQLTALRSFLEEQRAKKLTELNNTEDSLRNFQEKGGIISLDEQSSVLIDHLADLDAKRDALRIDLMSSNEILNQFKNEVKKQNPQLVEYLEGQTSQAYIDVLQKQIAELQMNRDMAMSNKSPYVDISTKMAEYNKQIDELKNKLNTLINDIKAEAYASSPDQIKALTQKLVEEEIKKNSLSIELREIQSIINRYERELSKLPEASIKLAQYQRRKESSQQLYLLIDEKYQAALINELSQPGNAEIISTGRVPENPAKPNRKLIIILGLMVGPIIAFGYILVKDYFDDTVKTPEDIQTRDINFLSWVPQDKTINIKEKIPIYAADSPISEAFRAIKARIQYSRIDKGFPQLILVTSPAEKEGKTFVSINLAMSFASSNKRTLLVDCDLRRPKVHVKLGVKKEPGLVDYLFQKVNLGEVIRNSDKPNFSYITSGTLPVNPAEILESQMMRNFLNEVRSSFDVVIIDSAPIVAVIDSEILSGIVDGTILVISADKTENKLMMDAIDRVKIDKTPFLGTVLNNFKYRNGYGYYFKYYYNYSSSNGRSKKLKKQKKF